MKRKKTWLLLGTAFALLLALGFVLFSELQDAREGARRTMCVHNLKMVAIALESHANEHGGRFPDKLSMLYPTYIVDLQVLVCPELRIRHERERGIPHPFTSDSPTSDEIDALCSYAYVPGLSPGGDKDTVIAYEKEDNHFGKGRSLLYLDGHGAWEPPENWRNGPPNTNLPEGF